MYIFVTKKRTLFVCVSVQVVAHGDDVVLSEAQFVVVVSLKIQQSLCPSPPGAGNNQEVFVILLVALHGVVRSQVLERQGGTSQMGIAI